MAHAGILAMENRRLVSYRSSNDSYQFIIYNKRMTIYIDALTWAWCRWDSIAIDMWTRCRNEIYGLWGAELAVIPPPLAFLLYVPSVCLHSFLTFLLTFRHYFPPTLIFLPYFLSFRTLSSYFPSHTAVTPKGSPHLPKRFSNRSQDRQEERTPFKGRTCVDVNYLLRNVLRHWDRHRYGLAWMTTVFWWFRALPPVLVVKVKHFDVIQMAFRIPSLFSLYPYERTWRGLALQRFGEMFSLFWRVEGAFGPRGP